MAAGDSNVTNLVASGTISTAPPVGSSNALVNGVILISVNGGSIGFTSTATAQASNPFFVAPFACRVVYFRVGIDPAANSGFTNINLLKNIGGDGLSQVSLLNATFNVTDSTGGAAGSVNTANTLAVGDTLQINSTSAVDQLAGFTIGIIPI